MNSRQIFPHWGRMIGCPNTAPMKRVYWSLSQLFVPETFLFIACSYYLYEEAQRSQPSADRLSFLMHEFVLNRSGPLYINVSSKGRMQAQALVNRGVEKRRSDAMEVLASCVDEVGKMVKSQIDEQQQSSKHKTLRVHMKTYDNPTKIYVAPKWMQVLFGAKEKTRVKTKPRKVDSDAIDLVINGWGETPWLAQLRTLS